MQFTDNLTAVETLLANSDEYRELPRATAGPTGGHLCPALRKAAYSSTRLCLLSMVL